METNSNSFYVKLTHLFYAVAMADKKMVVEEKRKIVSYVEKYWSHSFDKGKGKEVIYETMRELIKKQMTSEEAYEVFKSYVLSLPDGFSDDLSKKIMEAADGIATTMFKKNKSELILLTKLKILISS